MRISSISFSFSWTEPQTETQMETEMEIETEMEMATSNNCKQLNKRHARAGSDSQVPPGAAQGKSEESRSRSSKWSQRSVCVASAVSSS